MARGSDISVGDGATLAMLWPGMELEMTRRGEWVDTASSEPDPRWTFIDDAGHGHVFHDGYPTLRWVVVPCTLGHGDTCSSEGFYVCKVCDERIVPSERQALPQFVPGPVDYRLTARRGSMRITYRFGEAEWERLNTAVEDAVHGTLKGCQVEVIVGA
jgi:hypothetical protein